MNLLDFLRAELCLNGPEYCTDQSFFKKTWWNARFYNLDEYPPEERVLFEVKPRGRFGLPNKAIAYFGEVPELTWEEITPEFRDHHDRTEKKREAYYAGDEDANPTQGKIGCNIGVKIDPNGNFLNLYFKGPLSLFIETKYPGFIDNILLGETVSAYGATQEIAEIAYKAGFEGILYKSVRSFDDWIDTNIVIFEPNRAEVCWVANNNIKVLNIFSYE